MDYAEAQAAFFAVPSPTDPPPGSHSWNTPARRLRDAIERIALVCEFAR